MKDLGRTAGKDSEEFEDHVLHSTLGANRIRSHTSRYGTHRLYFGRIPSSSPSLTPPSSLSLSLSSTSQSSYSGPAPAAPPTAAGVSTSSVSSYLHNLPSLNLSITPPPRPPRPPGGFLGISNGRGIGYGRSLGSSYDSPLTVHGSFNGHVRSGANLYGGRSHSSGFAAAKASSLVTPHRSTSVFPIQKALEIAMKESRLLAAAASSRSGLGAGSAGSGTGMSSGITFVRGMRRPSPRFSRSAIITEYGPTPDISLDEDEDEGEGVGEGEPRDEDIDGDPSFGAPSRSRGQGRDGLDGNIAEDLDLDIDINFDVEVASGDANVNVGPAQPKEQLQAEMTGPMDASKSRHTMRFTNVASASSASASGSSMASDDLFDNRDIDIRAPAVSAYTFNNLRTRNSRQRHHYPGIAQLHHPLTAQSGALSLHLPRSAAKTWHHWSHGQVFSATPSSSSALTSSSTPPPPQLLSSTSVSLSGASLSLGSSTAYSSSSSVLAPLLPSPGVSFLDPILGLSSSSSLSTSSSSSTALPYQPSGFSPLFSPSSASSSSTTTSATSGRRHRLYSSTDSAVHAVRELLDSYPAPSPYCVDDKNRSPLHFAAASGDLELVEFLLERGVRPDCGRDIAGNMPLHLAIISNRVDVVAALLKAGADMTLASPMTHKTPLDLAESRLSYLLSRAQESSKLASSSTSVSGGSIDLFNSQALTTTRGPQYQSQQLLDQIKGIVSLLRPYVVRQQRLRHGERHKYRQKDRQWERAEKFVRQQGQDDTSGICTIDAGGVGSSSQWRMDAHSDGNYGDMEDEDDEEDDGDVDLDDDDDDDEHGMDTGESRPLRQNRNRQERTRMTGSSRLMKSIDGGIDADEDGDLDLNDEDRTWKSSSHSRPKRSLQGRRSTPGRRLNTDETEEALESLMNGLSLLEENRKQQQQQQQQQLQQRHMANGLSQSTGASTSSSSDIADGNLADSELDPRGEHEVDEALPDLLEQVQRVLESIKLNESSQGS